MSDTITVYSDDGTPIMVYRSLADVLGLHPGQRLAGGELWAVLGSNAMAGIALCKKEINARKAHA